MLGKERGSPLRLLPILRERYADFSAHSGLNYAVKNQRFIGTVMSIIPPPHGRWPQNLYVVS